ncbi:hypothetical protein D3C78_1465970 [compost metagenome]
MTSTFKTARKYGSKVVAAVGALTLSAAAFAQASSPIDSILDAVSLDGISTKLIALALVVVGIALVFKGPSLAKRIISKV